MIVVDASIILELTLQTPAASAIEQRLFRNEDVLHAPHLIDIEVLQVLRRYAARGAISAHRGQLAVAVLARFPMSRHPHEPLLPRIWALRANLTAYDAAYVALAEGLGCRLLSRDQALATAPVARHVVELI